MGRHAYAVTSCCVCHGYTSEKFFQLSTRAWICTECCEKKGDAVLGSVVRAERKARQWIKRFPEISSFSLSMFTGLSVERIEELRAKAGAS
jgi:hypothetical protein